MACTEKDGQQLVPGAVRALKAGRLPNPSLEPTRSGKAHWPPRAQYHVALVGQWPLPPRSAQLKR